MKNDFIFGFDFGIGSESERVEHAEWSMEAMTEQLAEQEQLDNCYAMETAATGFQAACEAELTVITTACLEANGKSAEEAEAIFRAHGLTSEFAMEAAKDVLARGAYMGMAKIKTIIAAIIKAISELVTFTTTTNKGFKNAKKLIKKQKEALRKKQGSAKITSDKFVRSIVSQYAATKDEDLESALEDLSKYEGAGEAEALLGIAKTLATKALKMSADTSWKEPKATAIKEAKTTRSEAIDEFKNKIMEKDELEKTALLTGVISRLDTAEGICDVLSKDKTVKTLDKIKSKLSKLTNEANIKKLFKTNGTTSVGEDYTNIDNGEFQTIINNALSVLSACSSLYKAELKVNAVWIDAVLTDAKAVEAMAA